ncbi:DsbA family oxidoreductase [Bacillus timonensis]|uniref:DsbA family oxidoreductase n=1 Tax=Bacillus timonensis TaxID=1033734 RepID=UPI000288FFE9|nr:DsbA family oxidoreductase [Bacillus timonensis]
MKIEVWSDFVCPFCYIGKRRLEEALEQFPNRDQVEVEFKSFELDPNAKLYSGQSIHELLASKYGTSVAQAQQMNENVGQQAEGVGLKYDFEKMKHTNTFDAHRLAKYAATIGKEKELTELLLHSYFEEGKLISDHDVLADLAESVGIARGEVLDVLRDEKKFANEVRIDEAIAQQIGVTGVPFFVINQKYSISGAQPTSTFLGALQQVWKEENPAPKLTDLSSNQGAVCTDESCDIPTDK